MHANFTSLNDPLYSVPSSLSGFHEIELALKSDYTPFLTASYAVKRTIINRTNTPYIMMENVLTMESSSIPIFPYQGL